MKTKNTENTPTTKRVYEAPKVETIQIDSEISLVMMSPPPGDPGSAINPLSFTGFTITIWPSFEFSVLLGSTALSWSGSNYFYSVVSCEVTAEEASPDALGRQGQRRLLQQAGIENIQATRQQACFFLQQA